MPEPADLAPEEWHSVSSSNVDVIRYLERQRQLEVLFKDGSIYAYYGPTRDVFEAFLAATSKGQFVWQQLRGKFAYKRL